MTTWRWIFSRKYRKRSAAAVKGWQTRRKSLHCERCHKPTETLNGDVLGDWLLCPKYAQEYTPKSVEKSPLNQIAAQQEKKP